jgi:hypothetical protein
MDDIKSLIKIFLILIIIKIGTSFSNNTYKSDIIGGGAIISKPLEGYTLELPYWWNENNDDSITYHLPEGWYQRNYGDTTTLELPPYWNR